MNEKLEKIIDSLLNIKNPMRNLCYSVFLTGITAIFKIGLILREDITQGIIFQTWIWIITLIFLLAVSLYSFFKLERILIFYGGLLFLNVIMFKSNILFSISTKVLALILIVFVFYKILKIKKQKKNEKPN